MFTTLKKTKKLLLLALTLSIFLVNGGHGYAITNVYDRSIFINSSLGGVTTSHTFSFYFPIPERLNTAQTLLILLPALTLVGLTFLGPYLLHSRVRPDLT
jgi:hypothetical protein